MWKDDGGCRKIGMMTQGWMRGRMMAKQSHGTGNTDGWGQEVEEVERRCEASETHLNSRVAEGKGLFQ